MTPRIEHNIENGIETKHCSSCKVYYTLDQYNYDKSTWDNLRRECKNCLKEYRKKNKERMTEYNKKYWQDTKEEQQEKNKKWREANPERVKELNKKWLLENAEYKKAYDKKYAEEHKEQKKQYMKLWNQKNYFKLKSLPENQEKFSQLQVKSNISRRIREILGQNKSDRTIKYVGCSLDKLRTHLEVQFSDGMNWSNYGKSVNNSVKYAWHIDHIIPCAAFDMNNEIHQKACFHYKNLQPLWADDNIRKLHRFDVIERDNYLKRFIEIYILP